MHALTKYLTLLPRAALVVLCCGQLPASAAEPAYRVVDKQIVPGAVRWDYLSFEPASKRLFLTRGDQVDVYDTQSKAVVGTIAGTKGVHGVALAPDLDRGFTSNGGDDTVTVFALSTLKTVAVVAA